MTLQRFAPEFAVSDRSHLGAGLLAESTQCCRFVTTVSLGQGGVDLRGGRGAGVNVIALEQGDDAALDLLAAGSEDRPSSNVECGFTHPQIVTRGFA